MAKVGYILLGLGVTGVVGYFVVFPYACPHCYLGHFRRFRTKEELEAHIAAEHPEEPVPYTLEVKVIEA